MELLRFSVFWCGTILFGSILLEEAGESRRYAVLSRPCVGRMVGGKPPTHGESSRAIWSLVVETAMGTKE